MIEFEIVETNPVIKREIQLFYDYHYPQYSEAVSQFLAVPDRVSHVVFAFENLTVAGMIPIIKLVPERDQYCGENHYAYFYTILAPEYRSRGLCNQLLKEAVSLLIGIGAKKIRVSKSSGNNVKHTIFTDMKFNLIKYDENAEEYKHTYELDVSKWGETNEG